MASLSLQSREGNGNPLQYSCLENPRDGGAWWAAVYGVAQSWTRLKRLSSSSSSSSLQSIMGLEGESLLPTYSPKSRLLPALASIPGLGRSPGEGKGDPLQYSGLENSWSVFSSVTQSCLTLETLWTAVRQASLSITNSRSLFKLMSIESVMPSKHLHPMSSPFHSAFNLSQHQGLFPMSEHFTSGGPSIGVLASTSVLPVKTQD